MVRPVEFEKDWEEISHWYRGHGWDQMDPLILPELGFVVPGYACAWLYQSDSLICWLEWLVTNPKADKKKNFQALEKIYDEAILRSKELGFTTIFSSFNHKSLIRLAEKKGFKVTENNMTNLVRSL